MNHGRCQRYKVPVQSYVDDLKLRY